MSLSIEEVKMLLIRSKVQHVLSLIPRGNCCFAGPYLNVYVNEKYIPLECDDCTACKTKYTEILVKNVTDEVMAL